MIKKDLNFFKNNKNEFNVFFISDLHFQTYDDIITKRDKENLQKFIKFGHIKKSNNKETFLVFGGDFFNQYDLQFKNDNRFDNLLEHIKYFIEIKEKKVIKKVLYVLGNHEYYFKSFQYLFFNSKIGLSQKDLDDISLYSNYFNKEKFIDNYIRNNLEKIYGKNKVKNLENGGFGIFLGNILYSPIKSRNIDFPLIELNNKLNKNMECLGDNKFNYLLFNQLDSKYLIKRFNILIKKGGKEFLNDLKQYFPYLFKIFNENVLNKFIQLKDSTISEVIFSYNLLKIIINIKSILELESKIEEIYIVTHFGWDSQNLDNWLKNTKKESFYKSFTRKGEKKDIDYFFSNDNLFLKDIVNYIENKNQDIRKITCLYGHSHSGEKVEGMTKKGTKLKLLNNSIGYKFEIEKYFG